MLQINKNQLPNMREDGSVKNTEKYTIAEYEHRGLRLEDLAERIASQLDSHFILYDYKGNIYTDNEDVIQILKDEFPSGDYQAYGNPTEGFGHDNMNIEWDNLLQLQEDENYIWVDYHYIPKWYYIYRKLAIRLNRIDTIFSDKEVGKQLYDKCFSSQDFRDNNEWIEKFDSEWDVQSLDPIHIFASLNNNKLGHEKRLKRINILFKILNENFKEDYKNINFSGCPTPNTTKIIAARDNETQKKVWNYFKDVITKSQNANIDFSKIQEWYGLEIGAFTIFLFWIDAKNFLPLDKNTEALLASSKRDFQFPSTYTEYKKLLIKKNTNLYILLSLVSYDSKKQNELNLEDKSKLVNFLENNKTDNIGVVVHPKTISIPRTNNFKLIAIKPLTGCSKKYLKTLKEDTYYIFDKAYKIQDDIIEVAIDKDISLYNAKNIKININAIAGKNGTGKSTIVELLFALIHNLSLEKKILKDSKKIENLNAELIYENDYIYKITINNNNFKCHVYKQDNYLEGATNHTIQRYEDNENYNTYKIAHEYTNKFEIVDFFYTIAVNYSQHSLNSSNTGDWIHSLFHKNDAYQTPIVIEPYRENGNIDINKQESLIKQRLLANLLLLEDKDDIKNSPRQLTEFYKAITLKITFNETTFNNKYSEIRAKYLGDINEEIKSIFYSVFDIDFKNIIHPLKQYIEDYIFIKLIRISFIYSHYNRWFKNEKKFIEPKIYFETLRNDSSHLTYKLKQAINFLKYDKLQYKHEEIIDIEVCSNQIEKIKQENNDEVINRYLPPSLFDIDIILENEINFNTLSSGEKQKIYSVNSILYHLNNIDSVQGYLKQYKNVNIVLDEIELYFHPELQRTYLNYLHNTISKTNSNNILGLNIIFVTHSPFILSDIPDTKILFLEKDNKNIKSKTITAKKEIKTFGANIHELLINGFFMDNSIGEYALNEIKNIVNFHYEVMNLEKNDLEKKKKEYNILKIKFYFIQECIGEDYIAGIIKNHLMDIEKRLDSDSFKDKRIKALKKELQSLEENLND
jgi:predicted ATPase